MPLAHIVLARLIRKGQITIDFPGLSKALPELLRRGEITVRIPKLDMKELRDIVYSSAAGTLDEIQGILSLDEDEMSDKEKVAWIRERIADDALFLF